MIPKKDVCDLYFNEGLQQNKIARIFGTSPQNISKIVNQDKRAKQEKERRKQENAENRPEYSKKYWKGYKRPVKKDNSYEQMKAQQAQDAKELSYSSDYISDLTFAKWNRQMFIYDNNSSDLVLRKGFNYACDVPKRVSNVINPIQRRVIC